MFIRADSLVLVQERVAEDIGLDTIVKLAHSSDPHVQQHAAGAIANLAFDNPAMEMRLVAHGAVPPLLALTRSPSAQVPNRAPTLTPLGRATWG